MTDPTIVDGGALAFDADVAGLVATGGTTTGVPSVGMDVVFGELVVQRTVFGALLTVQPPRTFPPGGWQDPTAGTVTAPPVGTPLSPFGHQDPVRLQERLSVLMPAFTVSPTGRPVGAAGASITFGETRESLGYIRTIIGGVDVSFLRGVHAEPEDWAWAESATMRFPQVTPFDIPGAGDLRWCREDANIDVTLVRPSDGAVIGHLFEGFLQAFDWATNETGTGLTVHAVGAPYQADGTLAQPPFLRAARDVRDVVAGYLDTVDGRRYQALDGPQTGLQTRHGGRWNKSWSAACADVLADAFTTDMPPRQWSVLWADDRRPILGLKDYTSVHATVCHGTPGVDVSLTADSSGRVDATYGSGTDTVRREAWSNQKHPNLGDPAPAYPYADSNRTMSVGALDGQTRNGGVSLWQTRMRDLGYRGVTVTGQYSAGDAAACRQVQRAAGLQDDGVVGPQTWASTFDVGAAGSNLSGSYYAPLALYPQVEPYLYSANGARTGANPVFDPSRIRREEFIAYGDTASKAQATGSALAKLARDSGVGMVGTIVLKVDPEPGSPVACAMLLRKGMNVRLRQYQGKDLLLHIVDTHVAGGKNRKVVTLTVDSLWRDAPTVAAVLKRQQEARGPAKRTLAARTADDLIRTRPIFDAESGAGVLRRTATIGGLWIPLRFPMGDSGSIVTIDLQTSGPATKFAFALFSGKVTPADMIRMVGDPLTARADGYSPWSKNAKDLQDAGILLSLGTPDGPAGLWPGTLLDPSTGAPTTHPVTGREVDTGGCTWTADNGMDLWALVWTPVSSFVEGRIFVTPPAF